MKSANKRWMGFSLIVLVMVVATAGTAISGFKGTFGGPFGGKGFIKERVLSKMDYTMQELKLTTAQQTKYSAIRDKMVLSMDKAAERHQAAKNTLRTEMDKPEPDLKKLAEYMKQEVRSMPDTVTMQIDFMLEMYDSLNKSQQTKLTQMLKERMERHGKRHGKHDEMRDHGPRDPKPIS